MSKLKADAAADSKRGGGDRSENRRSQNGPALTHTRTAQHSSGKQSVERLAPRPRLSATEKMAITAGSAAAMAMASAATQAGIVYRTGPVSLTLTPTNLIEASPGQGQSVTWDIDGADGNGDAEFRLFSSIYTYVSGSYKSIEQGAFFGSDVNGRGLLEDEGVVIGLMSSSDEVGPASPGFATGSRTVMSNYVVLYGQSFTDPSASVSVVSSGTGVVEGPFYDFDLSTDQSVAENYIGFRFSPNGSNDPNDYLYGWATLVINPSAQSVTITEWAYNDGSSDGRSIKVGDRGEVPEPSTTSLALLGLGASGLLGWRRRRQRAALQRSADAAEH